MNIDWLIGFLEGEGSLGKRKNHNGFQPYFMIYQKDKKVLEDIKNFLGFGFIMKNRECWVYGITSVPEQRKILTIIEGKLLTNNKQKQFQTWRDCLMEDHPMGLSLRYKLTHDETPTKKCEVLERQEVKEGKVIIVKEAKAMER